MFKRIAYLTAFAVTLACLAVPGALADQAYSDPEGDSGTAPDVTTVTAAHDVSGTITFGVTTNQATLLPETEIALYVDSDLNASTGLQLRGLGVDYFFSYGGGLGLPLLAHIVGNALIIDFNSSLSMSYGSGALTARINRSDLGNTERFRFLVEAAQENADGETIAADFAPDGPPLFEYSLAEALTLTVGKPVGASGKPVAGRPFTIAAPVTRSDGQPFAAGNVACRMKIGLTPIRAVGRIAAGSARCTARIPKNGRGKTLRGTMTVSTADAGPVMKAFAFKIV